MRLMRRRIMQAKACAHQRTKSCKATLCSVSEKLYYLCSSLYLDTSFWILSYGFNRSLIEESWFKVSII